MRGSFVKGAVVGLVCAVLGGAAVAFAGSGINGVFNLGVTNTVNAQTKLAGSTNAPQLMVNNSNTDAAASAVTANGASTAAAVVAGANASTGVGVLGKSTAGVGVVAKSASSTQPALQATNTGGSTAVYGGSGGGRGVAGFSDTWQGVYGHSNANAGVVGESLNFDGVYGVSESATHAAVSAHNDVWGGFGVWAAGGDVANATAAIHGQSAKGNGVEGISGQATASGVYGENDASGFGVAGRAVNGTGVLADSANGWALNASGNATQSRDKGGFVKAMAFVNTGSTDPIKQCFNSQIAASQATSGDCGLSYTTRGTGVYDIDFGFNVSDRIAIVTPANGCCLNDNRFLDVRPAPALSPNQLEVTAWNASTNELDSSSFYIVVY